MTVTARDDHAHDPGPGDAQEHWHVELVTESGLALFARLTCWPSAGVAWWWTAVVAPDIVGPVLVRAPELALPRTGALDVRGEGVWAELVCETPLEHWSIGLEAFGVRLDDPLDALRDEWGERIAVGLDLEWEAAGEPVPTHAEAPHAGYAQVGSVHGDVLLGRTTIAIDARGVRVHEWGDPRWWTERRERAFGVAPDGSLRAHDALDAVALDDTHRVAIVVDAPDGRHAALHRAVCRFGGDEPADAARGWAEWRDPAAAPL